MKYKLMIAQKHTYLHITITGQNSVENIVRYFDEIHRECIARNCFRILIEEHLDGPRIGIFDVFKIVQDASNKCRGVFKSIAYVDVNAKDNLTKFVETVAVNRSLPVIAFSTVTDAEKWMTDKDNSSTRPHTAADAVRSISQTPILKLS